MSRLLFFSSPASGTDILVEYIVVRRATGYCTICLEPDRTPLAFDARNRFRHCSSVRHKANLKRAESGKFPVVAVLPEVTTPHLTIIARLQLTINVIGSRVRG